MKKKALALISGGLDSMLAAKVIIDQGIHVEGINFFTGFTGDIPICESSPLFSARWIGEQLGIKVRVVDVVEEFKEILLHPKHGYGANLNPCLDCKIFMVNQAKKWIDKYSFDFLITGEVLGQRPKSQRKNALPLVAENTDDRLLRPLSAKLLPPTLPEREGWVKREELYAISGRSRKPQIELAAQFGIEVYPQPAGGCVLTDASFCKRLHDLWQQKANKDYTRDEIILLKYGRHLRPLPNFKLIVGRNEIENEALKKYANKYPSMHLCNDIPGPLVLLLESDLTVAHNLELAARITARFSKARDEESVAIELAVPNKNKQILQVKPFSPAEILAKWYV